MQLLSTKRLRPSTAQTPMEADEDETHLIPGLPDDVSRLCLSRIPPSLISAVCSSWRRLIYSPLFPPFLSLYAILSPTTLQDVSPIVFMTYDPIAGHWGSVPPPPPSTRLIIRHPSFISRKLPVQSISVSGRLVLLAATLEGDEGLVPALPVPLVFSPLSAAWSHGPALPAPRRWCAAGALGGSVFVASGIASNFNSEIARSFEKWNAASGAGGRWERLDRLRDGRLSREAIDAVGCRGKLWMVNVQGSAAKQGAVYDAAGSGEWEEMPEAMVGGWMGPAAAMAEEDIYVVDESVGALKRWNWEGKWVEVLESPMLVGAQQMTAAEGKICAVVGKSGGAVVVVDLKVDPARLWVVEAPAGYVAIAVHVLPRMCSRGIKRRQ